MRTNEMADGDPSYSRLSVFLITGVCAGLPALLWALRHLHLHRKIRGRISAFIVFLLLTDLMELIFNVLIVAQLKELMAALFQILVLFHFWSALHWCGLQLHQLVALEAVLTLKYPQCSAHIFSHPFYILISTLVLLFSTTSALTVFISELSPFLFSLGSCLAPLSLLAVTFIISRKAPPTAVNRNTRSVFAVAMVNLLMLYLPFALVIIVDFFKVVQLHLSWYVDSVCLMSLRVISDSLLCVLVCREHLRAIQTPQTQAEPNVYLTSV